MAVAVAVAVVVVGLHGNRDQWTDCESPTSMRVVGVRVYRMRRRRCRSDDVDDEALQGWSSAEGGQRIDKKAREVSIEKARRREETRQARGRDGE